MPHKDNYSYAVAKLMVEHYILGLNHKNLNKSILLINFKIGPVDTKFSKYGLTNIKTSSVKVAKRIFNIIVSTKKKEIFT